ncbi:MAG: hypothetical protein OEX04_12330 [Acidimicrobiia bacterium]|nr:hypothetical protein [Acidimicrobiia bacterium]
MVAVPRWLGYVWLVAGAAGLAAAVAVASFGVGFVGSSTESAVEALSVGRQLLETVGDTTQAVRRVVGSTTGGLDTLEGSVVDAAGTLSEVSRLADDLGTLVTAEIPASLDELRGAMPQLIGTAGVIDGVMRALSFVGANYDPDAPLDDSLRALDQRLAVIPDQLRSQASGFSEAADGVAEFGVAAVAIASDVQTIREELAESSAVMDGYTATVAEGVAVLDDLESRLVEQASTARALIVFLGVALAVGQTVPLAAGLWVVRSGRQAS